MNQRGNDGEKSEFWGIKQWPLRKRKKESYKEGETWELKYIRQGILRGKRKKKDG